MSVISQTQPRLRLPDQVTIDFGPAPLLAQSFLSLDRAMREQGIYLSISHDMEELIEVNERNQKDWYPLPPVLNARYSDLRADNAFWISGVNDRGEVVLAQAARLFHWPDSSLTDELESLRFFYRNPADEMSVGEHCSVETTATDEITGRVCYTGALWFRPEYRGAGLATLMPRVTRAYACTRWYPDYFFGLVHMRPNLRTSSLTRMYGWKNADSVIRWQGQKKYDEDMDFAVMWMDPKETLSDVEQFNMLLESKPRLDTKARIAA
jgi:GNAT superfamily N-acetyltransferase